MGYSMNWWEKDPQRLEKEKSIMNEKFPQFMIGQAHSQREKNGWVVAQKGQKYWLGDLRTQSGNIYNVLIVYPNYYPGGEIKTYIISPLIEHSMHRYGDGHLCLYSNSYGTGQGNGYAMTAVSYVAWVAAWLHAHEIYQKTSEWPDNNFFNRS